MVTVEQLTSRLATAFNPQQSKVLAEAFAETANSLVRRSDFTELKQN